MACFTVPLAEALVVSAVKSIALKKGSNKPTVLAMRQKVATLEKMLYGGSFLLAAEHIYHGEITFYPPFLTALNSPAETAVMLQEIATSGVAMAALVTGVWAIGLALSYVLPKKRSGLKGGAV